MDRWFIIEEHYGIIETRYTICATDNIVAACDIIDALVLKRKGTPTRFIAKRNEQREYIDILDNPIQDSIFECSDYSQYLIGIDCI